SPTLSLHDALPISVCCSAQRRTRPSYATRLRKTTSRSSRRVISSTCQQNRNSRDRCNRNGRFGNGNGVYLPRKISQSLRRTWMPIRDSSRNTTPRENADFLQAFEQSLGGKDPKTGSNALTTCC